MNLNLITKLFLILSLALLAKTSPIEEYPNEVNNAEGRLYNIFHFCNEYVKGRFFLNGEAYLCLVPYSGSIPKDVKELSEKHLIVLNENLYDFTPNINHTFKNCNINETDDNSINICYEEFADIIGVDVEAIKPKLELKETVDSMLQDIKDLCEKEEGIFFSNENGYICLVKPKFILHQSSINYFFIEKFIIYHDEYYTPHKIYTHIDYVEFYEYYEKIAELLNVNIDTLVPYKSFIDAMKEYFKFESKGCILYYEKENSFACFGLSLVPDDEDLNTLLSNHRVVKDGKFYYLTNSSFQCEKGDLSCYDRIAYVMDVDVESIIPKENMVTIIDIKRGCESESGLFYYVSNGANYICLRRYQEQEEADIPENSICFLNIINGENAIYCIKEQYTEVESCKKENEKFDYETCRKTVEDKTMKTFNKYPPVKVVTSITPSGLTTSKTIPSEYLSSTIESSFNTPEASLCSSRKENIAASYYIFIEGDGKSTDKQALLELVNDRMNEIYDIIYKNGEIYRDYCNNDINEELDTTYPEGTKFLFLDELKQGTTTSYDDLIPLKSSLIKVGNYLTHEEDGCSATASVSSGCHTIYAYLTSDMVEEVKKIPNIVKIEESNAYSYVTIKNNIAPSTTFYTKKALDISTTKAIPVITKSTKQIQETFSIEEIPMTTRAKEVPVITSAKEVPLITRAKEVPVITSAKEVPVITSAKEVPVITSAKEVPVTTKKCFPVIVTIKETETETITIKETVTVTI